ncbi:MAG TPA: chemotaxis protein CheX [bacterium]|nr:chemotaxis protein CheX [bacterium]HOL47441.1 chemotaxis protein CheX [bacterium]HPQ19508.1 chemotaxis protein CheX [bacterium]
MELQNNIPPKENIDIFFGKYLVEKNIITDKILEKVINFQKSLNKKIGDLAIEKKYLTPEQVNEIYFEQRKTNKYFGEIAREKGYLTKEQVEELLKYQSKRNVFIGEIFISLGYLTREQLAIELEEFHKKEESQQKDAKQKIADSMLNFIMLFIECAKNTVFRMVQIPLKLSRRITQRKTIQSKGIMIKVNLTGEINKNLIFNFDKEFVNDLLLKFYDSFPKDKIIEMRLSALKELVNIISGLIITELGNRYNINVNITPPEVIEQNIYTDEKTLLSLPFIAPEGSFEMNISY